MNHEVSHQDYYLELAQLSHLPSWGIPMNLVKTALAGGDKHLNTIPLDLWDRLAIMNQSAVANANKKRDGKCVWSLSDGVCALKALAVHLATKDAANA
jgi:hypothetical protein